MPEERLITAAISACLALGPRGVAALRTHFSPMTECWRAPKAAFRDTGLTPLVVDKFLAHRASFDFEQYQKMLRETEVSFITTDDPEYPELLKEIFDPPIVLYYRGELRTPLFLPLIEGEKKEGAGVMVAVVGTRAVTDYGRQITKTITEELARSGLTIVSGLALGVDALAHEATVQAGGYTIAVLGGGVDAATVYPRANAGLAERIIASGGAIVSEYPPGTNPEQRYFPERNRIIAGLSLGTLVTEAPIESGALITAKCAREENREVFAVPGNITYPNSEGANLLIKLGAHLVASGQDVLDVLGFKSALPTRAPLPVLSSEEQRVLDLLASAPLLVDELIQKTTLAPPTVLATLSLLELKGVVREVEGKRYVKT